jgi:nucleoside permease NupC
MQHTIGTTAAESLNAAACIFLGQAEAAILIEPAIHTMTESEIHAIVS